MTVIRRSSALVLLLGALACSGDKTEPEAAPPAVDTEQEVMMEAPQPTLTPAESTAAVAAQAHRADSMTRAVMGEVPKPEPHVETMADQISLCRTQAAQATGTIKEHLLASCKRLEARAAETPAPR